MKQLILIISIFLLCFYVQSKPISKEIATRIATNFFEIQSKNKNFIVSGIYSERLNNIITLYVFSFSPRGFVMVSADDNVKPILAYSVTGLFNNVPIQAQNLLKQYSKVIYEASQKKQSYIIQDWENILSGKYLKAKSLVTPLLTTTWNQTCFYNELCPSDTLGPCGHAVTGCVATSMGQVMKFWNYPANGQGSHSYNSQWYGNLSANFGSTTYNWANMTDTLASSNIDVATLLYHCGVSVDMDYYATSSGSNLFFAINALPNYFKYSNNIEFVEKSNYTDSLWIELLKSELDAGRPILYQGYTGPLGDAFVMDGYDSNNFFHIVWSNNNEGYFEMGNLVFNNNNQAVIKIMPIVSCDIALRNFVSPIPATFLAPSNIKIKLSNYDTIPHSNIPVSYSVDGGIAVTEIISGSVAGLSDTIYEFTQPYDFSQNPGHIYNVRIYSSLVCDGYKNNDTITAQLENVACVNPPYSMGFEPNENFNGWIVNDVDNDGNSWNYGVGGNNEPTCAYLSNSQQANDWLITKCIQLESNKMYKLSYYIKTCLYCSSQKLSVFIGNQQNISNLTILLASYNNIINSDYQKTEIYFTVPSTGGYYIGWLANGLADNSMVIDDINISEQSAIDVGLVSSPLPNESCDLQQENITVVVKNLCSSVLNNIPVSYIVNGSLPVTDTITTPIGIGDSLVYTFGTQFNFSGNGTYNVIIYTSLTNDTILNNDTLSINVVNHISITPVYTMGFEPSEDFGGWKIYNNNSDNYKWTIINSGGRTQPYCIRYDYSSWLTADDWFVTPCINLSSSQNYKLGFWYKAEASAWPEKLKVFIGNDQITSSLTAQLLNLPNIINTNYQYVETSFTVPSTGLYYIGWHCYSDSNMFNLYVDDILIDLMITNEQQKLYNSEYLVFPNPFKNEVNISNSTTSNENTKYEIINTTGERITELFSKNNVVTISTSNLNKGVYVLKITSIKGVIVKKIVKQ